MKVLLGLLAALCCLPLWAPQAEAHEVRPAYLEITRPSPGHYRVLWKQPVMGDRALPLRPRLSNGWLDRAPAATEITAAYLIKIWQVADTRPLSGETLSIDGLDGSITDVLVRLDLPGPILQETVLNARHPGMVLAPRAGSPHAAPQASAYLRLGIEHILGGVDHLCFVLGLILLVGLRARLLGAITAFTVAHSLTLAAAALGLVRLPSAVIEALVALSIVFVAVEAARAQAGGDSLTARRPWLIAFLFGLLHGLAFAGALAQIGLPQRSIPLALLLFNLGVEMGQLLFVATVLVIVLAVRRLPSTPGRGAWLSTARTIPTYAIGAFAVFWFLERMTMAFA